MFMGKKRPADDLSEKLASFMADVKDVIATVSAKLEVVYNKCEELETRITALEKSVSQKQDMKLDVFSKLKELEEKMNELEQAIQRIDSLTQKISSVAEKVELLEQKLSTEYAVKSDIVEIKTQLENMKQLYKEVESLKIAVKKLASIVQELCKKKSGGNELFF